METPLNNPEQEAQARSLFKELRCVVCQGQSVADSDAGVAQDMRRAVREKLQEGHSPQEVKAYFVERYGNFVLFDPPVQGGGLLLWGLPLLFLGILGAGVIKMYFSSRKKTKKV